MVRMAASALVDTNVLLRAMIPQMSQHAEAEALLQQMWQDNVELWISRQVIREYLVQATHPNSFKPALTIDQVLHQMNIIETLFRIADETQAVTEALFALLKAYPTRGKQIHDANLVAVMMANQIDTILTLNTADFRRFEDRIRIVSSV